MIGMAGWWMRRRGVLIGPDPQIERELTDAELEQTRPMGRPRLPEGERRVQVTMRWSPETIDALKARGPGYTNFAEQAVRRALREKNAPVAKAKKPVTKKAKPTKRRGR